MSHLRIRCCAALLALTASGAAMPVAAQIRLPASGSNAYGMPGVIDMPTATRYADGTLAFSGMAMPGTRRGTFAFQALPRLTLSFRYASANVGLSAPGGVLFDRSFDLHWQMTDEGRYLPAIALGLRDFLGTGFYSGEYLVATRTLNPRLRASLGIGWGRLATHGSFTNPLVALGEGFRVRPGRSPGDRGGLVPVHRFFRGPAALFAGIEFQATERLTVLAEYSSDAYTRESAYDLRVRTPINLGFRYRYSPSTTISGYLLHGRNIGLQASFALNPAQPAGGYVRVSAPAPIRHRAAPPPGGAFDTSWAEASGPLGPRLREALAGAMQSEGIRLDDVQLEARRVVVRFTNERHEVLPRAMGRTARILILGLPESVEEIVLIPNHNGVAGTAVALDRSDLERLEHSPDGAAALFARARFADPLGFPGVGRLWQPVPEGQGRFQWGIGPFVELTYFNPNNDALRVDAGLRATLRFALADNLSVNATASQALFGNVGSSSPAPPTPGYPSVRTNAAQFYVDRTRIDRLTLDYTFRPATDLYGRVTLGWLERMYAGASAELLWSPPDSRFALGIELNTVVQRDPNRLLGLTDLRLRTGHVSAYYDFGGGYLGQLDIGQYLAGDRGATLRLERTFASGIRVGAWATLTDMPFSVFGEGSFDKGISLTIPLTAVTGRPSTSAFSTQLRSLNRDGGAVLHVPGRLYPTIEGSRRRALERSWGSILQ